MSELFFKLKKKRLHDCTIAQLHGFTLIELLIVVAIIGLVISGAVLTLNDAFDRDVKKASNKLSSTINYLYNKSITDGSYIRLILDLEEHAYWVEATTDPFLMANPNDFSEEGELEERVPESIVEDEEDAIPQVEAKKVTFNKIEEFLLKPTKLPDSVFFKDVYVEHQKGAVEAGKETIAFFPNGYVEEAIINLRDEEDENYFSLKINPITGRVSIEGQYRSNEEL